MISLAYLGLWVFIFSLPWERFIVIPGVGVISRVLGAAAVGLAVMAAVISAKLRRWQLYHLAALLFVLWAGGVLLVVYNPNVMPKKFWTFVQLLLMVLMIWELAPSGKRLLGLLIAYIFGTYVSALDTILLYRRQAGALKRFAAEGGDPNDLAMTLALALPMAWYLGMTHPRPLLRWVCRAYLPVGLFAIGLTGSRGGMLASFVGLLIVPFTMTKLSPGKLAVAIALLALSATLAVAYVPQKIVNRLATTQTEVEDLSLGGRFRIWRAGAHAFVQRPLVGYGTGAFKNAVSPELGQSTQVAHNSFVSVLVEEGLIGFLLYSLMLVSVFLAVLKLPSMERRFALVLLATVVVAMLPLSWDDRKNAWFVLAALLGLSQVRWARPGEPLPAGPVRPLQTAAVYAPVVRPREVIEPLRSARRDGAR